MFVAPISNTNFKSGQVKLQRLQGYDLHLHYGDIKKLARENGIDFIIVKYKSATHIPNQLSYMVVAQKELQANNAPIRGITYAIVDKTMEYKEIAEKIYNSAIKSVETLNNKLQEIRR